MLGHHGISDPGEVVVKAAIENNIEIIPIPGACAAINALISSGMKTNEFIFIGFLPVNIKEKKEKLEEIKKYNQTMILYEAPHKLINTLKLMLEEIGFSDEYSRLSFLKKNTFDFEYPQNQKGFVTMQSTNTEELCPIGTKSEKN